MAGQRTWWKTWATPSSDFPADLEHEFRRRYDEASAPIVSTGVFIGIAILLMSYFRDLMVASPYLTHTMIVRLVISGCLVALIRLPLHIRIRFCQEISILIVAAGGVAVALIISLNGDIANIGLSGVIIVLMFGFGFLRLLFVPSLVAGAIVCLAYIGAAIMVGMEPSLIAANSFFLASAFFTGASITFLLERLFREQFLSERELVREREVLAQRSRNDARYLAWLRQLAVFLRHEVRHPVAQISSSIEIAQLASRDDNRIAPHLASAILSSQQVWNLIERASSATDAEAFVRQFRPSWTDLRMIIAEQVEVFRKSNSGVTFKFNCPKFIEVYLDSTLINEAIANLLSNAVSFANEGSTIEVGLATAGARAVVRVRNQGPRIAGDAEALFGPFASTRIGSSGEHHGIGLYLVRLIAQQHGGTATIANLDDGSGVEASVTLPL